MNDEPFDPEKMQERIDQMKANGNMPRLQELISAMQEVEPPQPKKKKIRAATVPKSKIRHAAVIQKLKHQTAKLK